MATTNVANSKGQHGGSRRGAGRKHNKHPANWKWLQIGAMLTHDEHVSIKNPNLTPAQRRHRLLCDAHQAMGNPVVLTNADLAFRCVRVAIHDESERVTILALCMSERRRRLLTVPPGGDLIDTRPGRWGKDY